MAPYICREYTRVYLSSTEDLPQFIGTSLALAIPLFMLHRQRAGKDILRISLNSLKSPPPPRRSSSTLSPRHGATASQQTTSESEPSDFSSSPGLVSALSQINQSSALLAAKAFIVATGLVAVGGVTLTWAVKATLGIQDVFSLRSSIPFFLNFFF